MPYNGWANINTWSVVNWYSFADDECLCEQVWNKSIRERAQILQEYVEQIEGIDIQIPLTGVLADIFTNAWSSIDWEELARDCFDMEELVKNFGDGDEDDKGDTCT